MKYEVIEDLNMSYTTIKATLENGEIRFIPLDEANSDYQIYLATLASELSNPSTPQAGE